MFEILVASSFLLHLTAAVQIAPCRQLTAVFLVHRTVVLLAVVVALPPVQLRAFYLPAEVVPEHSRVTSPNQFFVEILVGRQHL